MTVTIDVPYRTYEIELREGRLVLEGPASPDEACRREGATLRLTKTTVKRGLSLLEPDASGVLTVVEIPAVLVRGPCERCGSRLRVLPSDVLPRKHYGLAVIEHLMAAVRRGRARA